MADQLDVDVSLDPAGYLVGVQQIDQANQTLQRSFGGITTTSTVAQRALNAITPGRATIAAMTLLAREAAQVEQGMSNLSARSTVTDVSVSKLGKTIRQVARDFPLGYEASKSTVEQFTLMGVAAAGSEAKIGKLTESVTKLSGSTGEGPQTLAAGMTDLARATGNNNLDPKRFERVGDSLTTISAKSGASASNILAFSKNIAPMAQAAGIGTTGVLGISSAFAKLGEEGIGAQTAVNKMLTDMNRSVREGSPEIKTYASFVGKSADEFERLFKSNPAEALTQVTEAIAKAGPGGPRMLEQIGIEGVRGQRSIQALVASGGMRESIRTATDAYGGGSTDKAAQAAFGGLNDSLNELQESLSQTAEAFGQPLLGPLTAFTDALKVPADFARQVVSSDAGQKSLQLAGMAAMAAVVAKTILGPLGLMGLGRQAATSSVSRALFAGFAGSDQGTRAAQYGAPVRDLQARTGHAGTGMFRGMADRAYAFGQGIRESREERMRARMTPEQYAARQARLTDPTRAPQSVGSMAGNVLRAPLVYGAQLTGMYGNMLREQYRNARVPIDQRNSSMGTTAAMRTAWTDMRQSGGGGFKAFNESLMKSTSVVGSFATATTAHTRAIGQASLLMGRFARDIMPSAGGMMNAARSGGSALMRGASSLTGAMGGAAGIGLMGGMMIMSANRTREEGDKQRLQDYLGGDIQEALNAYKEAAGEAVSPTTTHSALSATAAESLAKAATTPEQALKVTQADRDVADTSTANVLNRYTGSPAAVAGQIAGMNPTGVSPQVMQAIKVDLLRQFDDSTTQSILGQLPANVFTQPGRSAVPTATDRAGIMMTTSALGSAETEKGLAGLNQAFHEFSAFVGQPFEQGSRWNAPREGGYTGNLTPETQKQIKTLLLDPIANTFKAQSEAYGGDYAKQEQYKAIDTAVQSAIGTGNVELLNQVTRLASGELLGAGNSKYLTPEEIQRMGGGSFVAALAAGDQTFGGKFKDLQSKQQAAGGRLRPEEQESSVFSLAKGVSPYLASFFDDRSKAPANQAVAASMALPGDVGKLSTAVNAMVDAARSSGKPMSDLGVEAAKLAGTMSSTSQEYALVRAAQQRAEFQMSKDAVSSGMTDTQAQMQRYEYVKRIASQAPSNDPAIEAERQAAEKETVELAGGFMSKMKQRLQAQREFDIQVSRIEIDAERGRRYAREDAERQVLRTEKSFNIQREEAQYQYQTSVGRAEEDFATQRMRTLRDFNIQAGKAERDMLRSRARAIRDFNTSLARQIEDAAATMLDPYTRIQTQATWDAKNLLVNMQEQTTAIAKQKTQLDQLRALGLSAQAIDILGLGKAENAQQVSNLLADAQSDPKVLAQITEEAKKRAAAAGALYTDSSNKDLRRQAEDFAKTLKDQAQDYETAVKDNREALARGLRDSETDFRKSMTRSAADYKHTLRLSQQQLGITLDHMAEDYARAYDRTEEARRTTLSRMREDLKRADQSIGGDFKTLNAQVNKALRGQAVDWRKIVKDDTKIWISDMRTKVMPDIAKVFSAYGLAGTTGRSGSSGAGSSAAADRAINGSGGAGSSAAADRNYAHGGEIHGWSPHPKADNIPIWATGGEFMQPVSAVQHYGVDVMEAIQQKRIPTSIVKGYAEGGHINPVGVPPSFPWGRYPSGGWHPALDYAVRVGTPVRSPYDATILRTGWDSGGFGTHIRQRNAHGTFTILGHLLSDLVDVGQRVRQGQVIAFSGNTGNSTGPHLHEEERRALYSKATAFDFTKGLSAQLAQYAHDDGMAQLKMLGADQVFAKLDQKKDGIYGKLRTQIKREFDAQYDNGGIMPVGGGRFTNETGKPEAVLTNEQWGGISKLAQVGGHMISTNDMRGIRAAAGVHIVINNSGAVTYDNRNDFAGAQITVKSEDPDQMARRLERRQTQQRVTQTRSVRRGS